MKTLTLDVLVAAIGGSAAAWRCRAELQPAGGIGTAVFPPTYEGGKYATVGFRIERPSENDPADHGRRLADQVLLDSVQSQANRMELALLDAWLDKRIELPVVTVDFSGQDLEKDLRVTSLEAPHRIADALLRDSLDPTDGEKPFRKSKNGARLDHVDLRNATALFEMSPTSLVFGMWDSTGPKGGLGAKFQRAIVSEIVALNAQIGKRTSSRIDPAQIQKKAAILYKSSDGNGISWTLDAAKAEQSTGKKKGDPIKIGSEGKPSEANHGNVTPTIADGGITFERAVQTTVLSLAALRRLRFPLQVGVSSDAKVDAAARTALAALGLCGAVLASTQCDLRSRCLLFPTAALVWELLDKPGADVQQYVLDSDAAMKLLNEAVAAAKSAKLPWMAKELVLRPSPDLAELVRKSQQLAASSGGEEDE